MQAFLGGLLLLLGQPRVKPDFQGLLFQIARIWISLDGDGGLRAGTATANRRAEVAAASVAVSGCLSGGKEVGSSTSVA